MANTKTNEKVSPVKKGRANFNIIGKVVLRDNSFKSDIVSENSGYQYNGMNIGIKTKDGLNVYAEAMGGFFPNGRDNKGNSRDNLIYVNDKDDFTNNYPIAFEDRDDKDILETINPMNFFNVGIELKDDEKTIIKKKFISEYDMIAYVHQHLYDGMTVNVSGSIEYSVYNDEVQVRKKIKNIFLSDAKTEDFKATFTQTILLNKDSIGRPKDGEVEIFAQVPEYISKIDGKEIKKTLALPQIYTIEITDATKKLMSKFMKAKKGKITEITMEGEYQSSVQTGEVTDDELSPDMIEMVEMGLFTKEDALAKQNQVIKGDRGTEVLILKRPHIKKGQGENAGVVINYCLDKYEEEDLLTHSQFVTVEDDEEEKADTPKEETNKEVELEEGDQVVDDEDADWLSDL